MSTSESELREVLIAMKIPRRPEGSTQSDIAFLYDYIGCVENMANEHYRIIEPAASAEPVACRHREGAPDWDGFCCSECGAFRADSGWGIASRMWFKSRDEAMFYRDNGRLPAAPGKEG